MYLWGYLAIFVVCLQVVDARAGPGTKSALKIKNKSPLKFKKHKKIKKNKEKRKTYSIPSPSQLSDEFSGEDLG